MPEPSPSPSAEQIETLRDLFLKKVENESAPCPGGFHPDDLNRAKTSSRWLQLFLEHCDLNMKNSLDMLWETCAWRKTYGTNEINESSVKMDYVKAGQIFPRNKDIDGKVLLIFRSKGHVKGSKDLNDLIKILVYWVERLHRETNYDQLSIFFDMQGAGLANLDLEFVKKIIETFKLYYPNSLNYIVIFEMAWILNAGFKIIKGILPPKAVAKMKFLTTKNFQEYITPENALKNWGGRDEYEFSFVPEKHERSSLKKIPSQNGIPPQVVVSPPVSNGRAPSPNSMKRVRFATSSADGAMSSADEGYAPIEGDAMLRISPSDSIVFKCGENDHQDVITGSVEIVCSAEINITYKIKTTSPEKFLVRPSSGILYPGQRTKITVTLQRGHQLSPVNKDKFLVMCMPLPTTIDSADASAQVLTELWKAKSGNLGSAIEQHRLRCVGYHDQADGMKNGQIVGNDGDSSSTLERRIGHINEAMSQLSDQNKRMEQQLKFSQSLQWITLIVFMLLSVAMVYILKQEINEQGGESCLKQAASSSI